MMTAWMTYALLVGALIALAGVSAEWALRSAKKPVRFVWVIAMTLTVLFTLVAPLRSEKEIALPATAWVTQSDATPNAPQRQTLLEVLAGTGRTLLQGIAAPVQRVLDVAVAAPSALSRGIGAGWIVSAVVALLVFAGVYARSMRERMRWPSMLLFGQSVRVTPDVGPAVIGVAPPEIVIPQWVLQRNANEQQLVLEHESEHVRAHDPLLLVISCIAVALMPWHAALWFMWSRLRLAVELDCDSRVLRRGVQKPAYGQLLVELSSRRPWMSPAMPAFSWGSSHLEQRLVAMTAKPARFNVVRRVVSGGVVAVALLAACESQIPTAAQIEKMDAKSVTSLAKDMSAQRGIFTDSAEYYVNDKRVTRKEAEDVLAIDINTVEIKRASKLHPVDAIHIQTGNFKRDQSLAGGTNPLDPPLDKSVVTGGPTQAIVNLRAGDRGLTLKNGRTTITGDTIVLTSSNVSRRVMPEIEMQKMPAGKPLETGYHEALAVPGQTLAKEDTVTVEIVPKPQIVLRKPNECENSRLRVRGWPSKPLTNCENQPLMVVNGVIVTTPLGEIDADDIESIEVIKGPAAAALYGTKAANGVISIKLKK